MRTVWSSRFEKAGLDGLADRGGQGRKPSLPEAKVARVITEATRPPKDQTRPRCPRPRQGGYVKIFESLGQPFQPFLFGQVVEDHLYFGIGVCAANHRSKVSLNPSK